MNILYTRIRELANDRNLSLAEIERRLKLSNGIISTWKNSKPSQDKIELIADFFKVSTDYLLGRTDDKTALSPKEMSDIGQLADRMLDGLESENSVNFYGEPMSDEDKTSLKAALLVALEMNKKRSKKD